MKTKIVLPTGEHLSTLKKINIDLEMWGGHYDQLMIGDKLNYERVVLSILDDLMVEDSSDLTMQELFYVFSLVKLNTLGPDQKIRWTCKREITRKSGIKGSCDTQNTTPFQISDHLENPAPENYEPMKFTVTMNPSAEKEEDLDKVEVFLRPSVMSTELIIIESLIDKGYLKESLIRDPVAANEFLNSRLAAAVVFPDRLIPGDTKMSQISHVDKVLQHNSFKLRKAMMQEFKRITSYGFANEPFPVTCKECGGTSSFRLPLSAGIVI